MPAPHGLNIPAMTSDAERDCYYRLAKEAAGKGAVIEFGAWLGASTAYMAAAMRDSTGGKMHTYDKFLSKQGHIDKVKEHFKKRGMDLSKAPVGDAFEQFKKNLGPLMQYVEPHKGEISNQKWDGGPIALIVNDAPKRARVISAMLANFRSGIHPGTVMAWQDFCHFPSYEIPACLYRLRDHFEFVEAVYPGSTLVFRVKSMWEPEEATAAALGDGWSVSEIEKAWAYWLEKVHPDKREVFRCGKAMFLCEIGEYSLAVEALVDIVETNDRVALKKWRYLHKRRPDFLTRYAPLFQYLERQGVFESEPV
jgi:methyltransferase family protein